MTETQYQSAVTAFRTLYKRSETDQWRLAQLTYENASPNRDDGKKSLARWALDVGRDDRYVGRMWRMWQKYGQSPDRPLFNDAYHEFSPTSAYQSPKLTNQTITQQAAEIQAALSDPEVASKVFADPASKVHAIQAIHHHDQHLPPAPLPPSPTRLDLLVLLDNAKDHLRRASRLAVALDTAGDDDVLSHLAEVETEAEQLRKYLTGMGLDEALAEIMEGT